MEKEILFWSISVLTIVPALLVASGYWNRGAFITVPVIGVGLAVLLWFHEAAISALVVIVVTIAGSEWRSLNNLEPNSNAISWSKSLFAAMFCGIVGGALFSVLDSLESDKQHRIGLLSNGLVSEGTSFSPSRLFDADMLLLWVIAVVAVVVWKIPLPARQGAVPIVQPNRRGWL